MTNYTVFPKRLRFIWIRHTCLNFAFNLSVHFSITHPHKPKIGCGWQCTLAGSGTGLHSTPVHRLETANIEEYCDIY